MPSENKTKYPMVTPVFNNEHTIKSSLISFSSTFPKATGAMVKTSICSDNQSTVASFDDPFVDKKLPFVDACFLSNEIQILKVNG